MSNRRFTKVKPGGKLTWEFVEKEKEPVPLTTWQKIVAWFKELPIWSIK